MKHFQRKRESEECNSTRSDRKCSHVQTSDSPKLRFLDSFSQINSDVLNISTVMSREIYESILLTFTYVGLLFRMVALFFSLVTCKKKKRMSLPNLNSSSCATRLAPKRARRAPKGRADCWRCLPPTSCCHSIRHIGVIRKQKPRSRKLFSRKLKHFSNGQKIRHGSAAAG